MTIDPLQPSSQSSSNSVDSSTERQQSLYYLKLLELMLTLQQSSQGGSGADRLKNRIEEVKKEVEEGKESPTMAINELMTAVDDYNREILNHNEFLPVIESENSVKQQSLFLDSYAKFTALLDKQGTPLPDNLMHDFHDLQERVHAGVQNLAGVHEDFLNIVHTGNEYLPSSLHFPEPPSFKS